VEEVPGGLREAPVEHFDASPALAVHRDSDAIDLPRIHPCWAVKWGPCSVLRMAGEE
jgi:hypothetical protein